MRSQTGFGLGEMLWKGPLPSFTGLDPNERESGRFPRETDARQRDIMMILRRLMVALRSRATKPQSITAILRSPGLFLRTHAVVLRSGETEIVSHTVFL